MKEPELTYDINSFQAVIEGPLAKGGILSSSVESFTIHFFCPPLKTTKSDIELSLYFQNNQSVRLYFQKECDTVGDTSEFDILYTIYWLLLWVLTIAICVIIYYYIKRNNSGIEEVLMNIYYKCSLFFQSIYNKYLRRKGPERMEADPASLKLNNFPDNVYEENEIVDVKIKTSMGINDGDRNEKNNSFNTDYGGI